MNYNDLTQEKKESINPELRKLFEGIENAKAFPEVNMYCYHIECFQEGLKTAIKIIDETIKILNEYWWYKSEEGYTINERIEELKKQRKQLQFEVELE